MSQHANISTEHVDVHTKDGIAGGTFYHPAGGGRWPGVLMLTDIGGIRPSYDEAARRLAAEGFLVLLPNVFYRTGKPPVFDFPTKWGEERTMTRFAELTGPLTAEAMEADGEAYVHALTTHHAASGTHVGVVGYCFTGAMAMRAAAAAPAQVALAMSFHGGRLYTDAPTSPHLILPRIKARLYFGHAVNDQSMTSEAIASFEQALRAWGGRFESELYEGAHHGWTVPDSPVYNQAQAEHAFTTLRARLNETLR